MVSSSIRAASPRSRRAGLALAFAAAIVGLGAGDTRARADFAPPSGLRARTLGLTAPVLRGALGPEIEAASGVAAPFVLPTADAEQRLRATRCLADAIYYEAALEPVEGQRAVAQVVLNRVRDPNFPKSICAVVYEGWKAPAGCQFSFACDGSLARPPERALYRNALDIAGQALAGHVEPEAGLATHYHATSVDPPWRVQMVRIAQIGSQIFYRWPGAAGRAEAFTGRYAGGEQVPPADALLAAVRTSPVPPGATPNAAPSAGPSPTEDQVVYRLGRRVRSPAEIQAMNQWLEAHRPAADAQAAPQA